MIQSKQITVSTGRSCSSYGIPFANLLAIKREGIGFKFEETPTADETQTIEAFSFQYKGSKPFTPPPGFMFFQASNGVPNPPNTNRLQYFYVGVGVMEGVVYKFTSNGTTVSYTTPASPTRASVLAGIASLINAGGWAVYVSATVVTLDRVEINISSTNPTYQFTAEAITGQEFTFISGIYCTIDGLEYIINSDQDYISMPAVPALAASYDFGDLTQELLASFLSDPLYSQQYLVITSLGNTDIDLIPVAVDLYPSDGNTVFVSSDTLYFANIFSIFETITILYK